MARFRKKPVAIEAEQYVVERYDYLIAFLDGCVGWMVVDDGIRIPTLEGEMFAKPGDWIIRGVKGEFYPCKPDIFVATYEPAEPHAHPE